MVCLAVKDVERVEQVSKQGHLLIRGSSRWVLHIGDLVYYQWPAKDGTWLHFLGMLCPWRGGDVYVNKKGKIRPEVQCKL